MNSRILKILWITLLSISYGGLSYCGPYDWRLSSLGTMGIAGFGYLAYKKDFQTALGLKMNWKSILLSFILLAVFVFGTYYLMKYIGNSKGIILYPGNYKNYYHIFFYTLNEEIVLGGILIYILKVKWKIRPIPITFSLALFFASLHYIFYRWVFIFHTNLHIFTLITLFFVGVLRYLFILKTNHIGYAWALHFGWMVLMFGGNHLYISTNERLNEPQLFNIYLGSYEMLGISFFLASIYFIIIRKSLTKSKITAR
ncbi:MAG: hypothetical protein JXB49_16785 [Bacteroidales bacterium]|nr:hypothetical protein [Bacteroidales bacterium]